MIFLMRFFFFFHSFLCDHVSTVLAPLGHRWGDLLLLVGHLSLAFRVHLFGRLDQTEETESDTSWEQLEGRWIDDPTKLTLKPQTWSKIEVSANYNQVWVEIRRRKQVLFTWLLCKDIEYIKSNIKVNLRDTGRGKINKSLLGMKTDKNSRKTPLPFKFLYFFYQKQELEQDGRFFYRKQELEQDGRKR